MEKHVEEILEYQRQDQRVIEEISIRRQRNDWNLASIETGAPLEFVPPPGSPPPPAFAVVIPSTDHHQSFVSYFSSFIVRVLFYHTIECFRCSCKTNEQSRVEWVIDENDRTLH